MLYQTGNPHGGDRYGRPVALDFSANTNPLGTPEAVRRAVAESAACLDRYPDPYCRALVGALADYEQVPEKYLLCGCGAAELIFSYCAALRPRRALELAPTFSEYAAALTAAGCGVERHTLSRCTDFRLTEAVLPVLRQAAWDVVFLCNPNNPTGQLVEPGLLAEICRICREKEIRMFVDECFLDLADPGRSASLKPLLAEQPGLFLLKAFTKSYGMAGLRLGYCLSADGALLRAMGRTVQPWNVSLPAQAAGVAALGESAFLARTRRVIRAERAFLRAGLEQLGLYVCPSQANYLLFYSPLPLQDALLERGILVRDCSNYRGLDAGWYRIAVRRHEENQTLLSALSALRKEA